MCVCVCARARENEYYVSQWSFVVIEGYNVMVNSKELIGATEYLIQAARYRINQCRFNRVPLYLSRDIWECTNGNP